MALGASTAWQVAEIGPLAADADTATTTLVDNRPVNAMPMHTDEIALRMKRPPGRN